MKRILALLSFGLLVASLSSAALSSAVAAKKTLSKKKKTAAASQSHLQTDVSFDDSVLRGEYQAPEEALAKVENEKGFGDLIGVRKHFKDRLSVASEQE